MIAEAGQTLDGRYVLDRPIAEGGFGSVWAATEIASETLVAIKFLKGPLDRDVLARFDREVEALRRLTHDHILALHEAGQVGDTRYLVTEYVEGTTLGEWMTQAPRGPAEVRHVGAQIASALATAHRAGIVHRDLKPANVMVVNTIAGPSIKLLDFGIAKMTGRTQTDITKTGEILGTPGFMSPEQLRGQTNIGPATDLYNLGVILWEALEQRPIFSADSALGICMAHLTEHPPMFQREVPDDLRQLIFRLLAKDPRQRGSAAVALGVLRGDSPRPAQPLAPSGTPLGGRARLYVAGGSLLVLAFAFAFGVRERSQEPPTSTHASSRDTIGTERRLDYAPAVDERSDVGPGTQESTDAAARMDHASAGCFPSPLDVARIEPPDILHHGKNHDLRTPAPLVVLLHDSQQRPADYVFEGSPLVDGVDARGWFLLVPTSVGFANGQVSTTRHLPWSGAERAASLPYAVLDEVLDEFCVDTSRIYLVGVGRGALAAQRWQSRRGGFTAIATTALRREAIPEHRELPEHEHPIPYLSIMPTTMFEPVMVKCNHPYVPFAEQEGAVRTAHGCTGEQRATSRVAGDCSTWTCDVEYVSCTVDAKRRWYARTTHPGCDDRGSVTYYDYATEILTFFDGVSDEP